MIHSSTLSNIHAPLYVVTCISNPCRYQTRYKLYREFEKRVNDQGAILYTIEMAFGNRAFELTEANDKTDIQVRSSHNIWLKECLLNKAVSHLPLDWEYVAFLDADIQFCRPDWVKEILHQLQHHPVVQPFTHAIDLSPKFEIIGKHNGFIYSYRNNLKFNKRYLTWHPGFGIAMTKQAFNDLGGLFDIGILGSGDRHFMEALVGEAERGIPTKLHNTPYHKNLIIYQERALKYIKRNVGYVEGTINHFYHGKKQDRGYQTRWQILTKNGFNPDLDLKKDSQGVWQLTDNNYKLRDDIHNYFVSRNEDSIDIY